MNVWNFVVQFFAFLGALAGLASLYLYIYHRWKVRQQMGQPTWDDVLRVAEKLLIRIEESPFTPDAVIGLGRSGGIWGGWLAGNLGTLPLAVVDLAYRTGKTGRNVKFYGEAEVLSSLRKRLGNQPCLLVVEGATSDGLTVREFFSKFESELSAYHDVRMAVLYKNSGTNAKVDFFGRDDVSPWPRKFPWHKRDAYKPHLRYYFEQTPDVQPNPAPAP